MYSKVQGKGSDLSGRNCPLLLATTLRLKVWCMLRKFYCQTKIDPKEIFLQVVYKLKLKYQWEKVSRKFPITVKPLKYLRPMLINKCCVSFYQDLVCLSFFCSSWKQEIQSNGKTCCLWINKDFLMDGNTEGDRSIIMPHNEIIILCHLNKQNTVHIEW